MENPYLQISNAAAVFFLILARMSGLFVIAPIFGRRNLPTYYKVGFAFFLSLIVANMVPVTNMKEFDNVFTYTAIIAKEFVVGLTLGYVANMIFTAIYFAGQIIDTQIGFGMVNVIDPMSNIQVAITAQFYFICTMMIFLLLNGHHVLIRALFESYQMIPMGAAVFNDNLLQDILRIFGDIFVIAFKIGAPVIGALLFLDVAMGIIARTVPQFNIFVVGLPLKILLGLLVMVISMPMFIEVIEALIKQMDSEMYQNLKHMGGIKP